MDTLEYFKHLEQLGLLVCAVLICPLFFLTFSRKGVLLFIFFLVNWVQFSAFLLPAG